MGERTGQQAGRWLAIVDRMMNAKAGVTIAELAAELNCTPRTIYRDLEAIGSKLGVPLTSDRPDAGPGSAARWRMMEDSRWRTPLEFTPSELLSVLAAEKLLAPLAGTPYGAGLRTLIAKLAGRFPEKTAACVAADGASLAVGAGVRADYRVHRGTIELLRRAVGECRTVEIRYASLSSGQETTRRVDPYRLWFAEGTLYLVGACHVHGHEPRTFAVDRIRTARTTDDRFIVPSAFRWEDYVRDSFRVFRGEPTRVVVRFSRAIAPLVRERVWHPSQRLVELPGGELGLTMTVAGIFEVAHWILSFGAHAVPVSPVDLVVAVRREVDAMQARLRADDPPAVQGGRRASWAMAARTSRPGSERRTSSRRSRTGRK